MTASVGKCRYCGGYYRKYTTQRTSCLTHDANNYVLKAEYDAQHQANKEKYGKM